MQPAYLTANQLYAMLMSGEGVTPERLRKARARASDRVWAEVMDRLGSGVEDAIVEARARQRMALDRMQAHAVALRAERAKHRNISEDAQRLEDEVMLERARAQGLL